MQNLGFEILRFGNLGKIEFLQLWSALFEICSCRKIARFATSWPTLLDQWYQCLSKAGSRSRYYLLHYVFAVVRYLAFRTQLQG